MRRPLRLCLLALVLASCRTPEQRPRPSSGPAPAPVPAHPQGSSPPVRPQFTFASWSQAVVLIKEGKVIQTVSGKGGFSLILQDHTWVRLVAKPGDPLPGNPKAYVQRNAPNAAAIKHSTE